MASTTRTFGFTVDISQADVKELSQNGYSLAVQRVVRVNGVQTPNMQWFSYAVDGTHYEIFFDPYYQVYITDLPIVEEGEPIPQTLYDQALLGNTYSYNKSWSQVPNTEDLGTIKISTQNNYKSIGTFGISQQVEDPSGEVFYAPIVFTPILQTGWVNFTLEMYVRVFWSKISGRGVVQPAKDPYFTVLLQPHKYPKLQYNQGQWWVDESGTRFSRSVFPSSASSWSSAFEFTVTTPVFTPFFTNWLQREFANSLSAQSEILIQNKFVVLFEAEEDFSQRILALAGKYYQSYLINTLVDVQKTERKGERVHIILVEPSSPSEKTIRKIKFIDC